MTFPIAMMMTSSNNSTPITPWTLLIWTKSWLTNPRTWWWLINVAQINTTWEIRMTFYVYTDWYTNISWPVTYPWPLCSLIRQYRWATLIQSWWITNNLNNWNSVWQSLDINATVQSWDIFKWEYWKYSTRVFSNNFDYYALWLIWDVNFYTNEWDSWAITIL